MCGLLLPVGRIAYAILHKRLTRIGFASRIVLSVVLPSVLSRAFDYGEASPSPVYGARLLSGLRAQPSRGFKSRRLRHRLLSSQPPDWALMGPSMAGRVKADSGRVKQGSGHDNQLVGLLSPRLRAR
jgi:hypothetical protein